MHTICEKAGMPIEHRKSEGPSTSLVFLGIEIDSVRGVLRLPEKNCRLSEELLQLGVNEKLAEKGNCYL